VELYEKGLEPGKDHDHTALLPVSGPSPVTIGRSHWYYSPPFGQYFREGFGPPNSTKPSIFTPLISVLKLDEIQCDKIFIIVEVDGMRHRLISSSEEGNE
jgi:hypothetical protein